MIEISIVIKKFYIVSIPSISMRGVFILGVVFLFLINLTSASYLCVDDTPLISDTRTIGLGNQKNTNGVIIGVSEVEERPATKRIMARLIVDAQLVLIVNNSSAQSGSFTDGTGYSISVVNITAEGIGVKVGSINKLMEIGEINDIDGKVLNVMSYVGDYPGWFNASFMIGKDEIYLANWETINEIFKINSENYLASLISASNSDATIKISKCQNASMEIKEIVNNNSANSNETAEINDTATDNSTIMNDTEEAELNESLNISDIDGEGNEGINSNQKMDRFLKIGTYIGGALTILVILFIILKYMQKKKEVNAEVKENKISN